MNSFEYWDEGQRKVMTSNELMALECPSDSEDGLDFDDSDADPTVKYKDLQSSDSESEPETAAQTVNSNTKDSSVTAVHTSDKRRIGSQKNILWKKSSAPFSGDLFPFKGNTKLPQSILELSTPYQFFRYFLLMK